MLQRDSLRLAPTTRVRTSYGLGAVVVYRGVSDSYVVDLDFGASAYLAVRTLSLSLLMQSGDLTD